MASQYSSKPPHELPMAWMYSHMISGWVGVERVAHATRSSTEGYLGATMADAAVGVAMAAPGGARPGAMIASPGPLSYATGRHGSQARNQVAAPSRAGDPPLSLPR